MKTLNISWSNAKIGSLEFIIDKINKATYNFDGSDYTVDNIYRLMKLCIELSDIASFDEIRAMKTITNIAVSDMISRDISQEYGFMDRYESDYKHRLSDWRPEYRDALVKLAKEYGWS